MARWTLLFGLFCNACAACEEESIQDFIERSEGTTRVVATFSPFSLQVFEGERLVGRTAERGCPALSLALKGGTSAERFHPPEEPTDDLAWLESTDAELQEDGSLLIPLKGDLEGESARLTLTSGVEGFIDIEIQFTAPSEQIAMNRICWQLREGEHVVGAGERFDGVDLLGRVVPLYFAAPRNYASSTNESHAPVPFFATTQGFSVLTETERVGAYDVGATDPDHLRALFHGDRLPLRVRAGSILDNAAAHARRMGLPPKPPRWVLAPQQWRNEHAVTLRNGEVVSTGQDRVLADARKLRELEIPGSLIWIDAPWSTGHNTFQWNRVQFPDPDGMLAELEALGFHAIVWATEHMNTSDDSDQQVGMPIEGSRDLYDRFAEEGWLVEGPDGKPFRFQWGRGFGGHVDFSNPEAVVAYQDLIRPVLEQGIRGFKLDYGETMRADLLGMDNRAVTFHDGAGSEIHHTRYSRLFHEAMIGLLKEIHPEDWYVITRTGGIYDTKNGITLWPGDLDNDFRRAGEVEADGRLSVGGLPAAVSAHLSASMSGYPLYGSDIGGYRGGPSTTEVLLRWSQFGALSTVMQLGGGGRGDTTHNPWDENLYDTEIAVPIYRTYSQLHMRLLPTIEGLIDRAVTDGSPPLVPVGVAAGEVEAAWNDEESYLFGPDLLVAPVVEEATERQLFAPEGQWFNWWDDSMIEGNRTHVAATPLEIMPIYQRGGSLIAMTDPRLRTVLPYGDEDLDRYGKTLWLRVLPGLAGNKSWRFDGAWGASAGQGNVSASQITTGSQIRINVNRSQRGRTVIELRLRPDTGPDAGAQVTVGGATISEVAEDDFLECIAPCIARGENHLLIAVEGERPQVQVGLP